ncbi:MAG: biopolymer transporter ExbD [Planctomycetota bacterium]
MSFATQTRERSAPVLPLAGMVDVLFLLLIFFMTASVFRDAELSMDVSLPSSETAASAVGPANQIVITVDAENRVFLGEREVPIDGLRSLLEDLVAVAPNDSAVVRADQGADWGVGVRVMDLAQQAGLTQVQAATVRPAEE